MNLKTNNMKITPVQSWANGQAKEATEFNLRIISDNLLDSATFYYSLTSEESEVVAEGNLTMDSVDYEAWDNSNDAAYAYALDKLKLVVA